MSQVIEVALIAVPPAVISAPILGQGNTPRRPKKPKEIQLDVHSLLHTLTRLLVERPKGWYNVAVRLNNNLTEYLRGSGRTPKWEDYPIARDWFTQNSLLLKEN